MTTKEVVDTIIISATRAEECRYASLVPKNDVWTTEQKRDMYFISHGAIPPLLRVSLHREAGRSRTHSRLPSLHDP